MFQQYNLRGDFTPLFYVFKGIKCVRLTQNTKEVKMEIDKTKQQKKLERYFMQPNWTPVLRTNSNKRYRCRR